MTTTENKITALAQYLNVEVEEITQGYDENNFEYGSEEYLVVTDDEADDLWDQDLENYIDECIIHEIPEGYKDYFDREGWKSDARYDGRAHSLNRYDGGEEYEEVDGETYYIYRQN